MITLNNVPIEQKKKVEYLPKKPIYPYFTPNCPRCRNDEGVLVCTTSDPKQYYCLVCKYDFFYMGCLNCHFATLPPFSFECMMCSRNPFSEEILKKKYYKMRADQGLNMRGFSPFGDRWEPYEKLEDSIV